MWFLIHYFVYQSRKWKNFSFPKLLWWWKMTLNSGKKTKVFGCSISLVFLRPCKENYSKQEEHFFLTRTQPSLPRYEIHVYENTQPRELREQSSVQRRYAFSVFSVSLDSNIWHTDIQRFYLYVVYVSVSMFGRWNLKQKFIYILLCQAYTHTSLIIKDTSLIRSKHMEAWWRVKQETEKQKHCTCNQSQGT